MSRFISDFMFADQNIFISNKNEVIHQIFNQFSIIFTIVWKENFAFLLLLFSLDLVKEWNWAYWIYAYASLSLVLFYVCLYSTSLYNLRSLSLLFLDTRPHELVFLIFSVDALARDAVLAVVKTEWHGVENCLMKKPNSFYRYLFLIQIQKSLGFSNKRLTKFQHLLRQFLEIFYILSARIVFKTM